MGRRLAFFIDIDETLMTKDAVPAANVEAIKKAQADGHFVLLNTGRSYGFIPPNAVKEFTPDGVVASIGATVIVHGQTVLDNRMDFDDMFKKLIPYINAGSRMHIEAYEKAFAVNMSPALYYVVPLERFEDLKNFSDFRFSKITMFYQSNDRDKSFWGDNYHLLQHARYLEVSIEGTSKASGLMLAAQHLGIPIEDTVAIGDGLNDLDMLRAAGKSVAMGNALDEVKAACDLTVARVEDGGVAEAINTLTREIC